MTRQPFRPWLEIASRDKTCGWISPGDLWAAPDGAVHIVWTERAIDERLRAKFFPEAKQRHALNHAVLRDGKVQSRRTLIAADEGQPGLIASLPRFQITPDRQIFLFCHVQGTDEAGKPFTGNRLMQLRPDGSVAGAVNVPLAHPLTSYFTATPRGGSAPSRTLDLLGNRADTPNTIAYARIRIEGGMK